MGARAVVCPPWRDVGFVKSGSSGGGMRGIPGTEQPMPSALAGAEAAEWCSISAAPQ